MKTYEKKRKAYVAMVDFEGDVLRIVGYAFAENWQKVYCPVVNDDYVIDYCMGEDSGFNTFKNIKIERCKELDGKEELFDLTLYRNGTYFFEIDPDETKETDNTMIVQKLLDIEFLE